MHIRALCNTNVVTVSQSEELMTAAALMRDRHVGYLVVAESMPGGAVKPIGVLTDRDIVVGILAMSVDPKSLRVGDVMTQRLVMVEASKSLEDALRMMRRDGVRRVPVIGHSGELVGVLSLDDIVEYLAKQLAEVSGSIQAELKNESTLRPASAGDGAP